MTLAEIPKTYLVAFVALAFVLWTYIVWTQGTFNGMKLRNQ